MKVAGEKWGRAGGRFQGKGNSMCKTGKQDTCVRNSTIVNRGDEARCRENRERERRLEWG